jgi:hypothetical protein
MEKKLPDDHLEAFLKKSLDTMESQPSENVWNRLNTSLDNTPSHKIHPISTPALKSRLLAAAAILVGIIGYLLFHNAQLAYQLKAYQAQTVPASKKIENPESETQDPVLLPDSKHNLPAHNDAIRTNPESLNSKGIQEIKPTEFTNSKANQPDAIPVKTPVKKEIGQQTEYTARNLSPGKDQTSSQSGNAKTHLADTRQNNNKQHTAHSTKRSNQINDSKPSSSSINPSAQPDYVNTIKSNAEPAKIPIEKEASVEKSRWIYKVASIKSSVNSIPENTRQIPAIVTEGDMIPTQLSKKLPPTEWMVFGGWIDESGQIVSRKKIVPRPGAPVMPAPINRYQSVVAWKAGLQTQIPISNSIYLVAGLGVKNYEMNHDISYPLKFGERKPKPGNRPIDHDFNFKMPRKGGSTDITVMSEQLDSRASINDNEALEVSIRNEYALSYIHIPLALQFRAPLSKKIFLVGQGGVQLDLLTRSRFQDPSVKLSSSSLRLRSESLRYKPENSENLVFNSLWSVGLGYSIAPRVKLMVTPEWNVSLQGKTSDPNQKIKSSSWGIQAGLSFNLNSLGRI